MLIDCCCHFQVVYLVPTTMVDHTNYTAPPINIILLPKIFFHVLPFEFWSDDEAFNDTDSGPNSFSTEKYIPCHHDPLLPAR